MTSFLKLVRYQPFELCIIPITVTITGGSAYNAQYMDYMIPVISVKGDAQNIRYRIQELMWKQATLSIGGR